MNYEDQLRSMLLRYPHRADEVKVYINTSISGCCSGYLNDLDTCYKEVYNPEDADYIPIWLDYKSRCSEEIWNWVEKYPDKCISAFNYLQSVNAEMPEMDEQTKKDLIDLLESSDWESLYLGLSILRQYYLTDELKNLAKFVIDTVQRDSINNNASIIPFGKKEEDRIEIGNLDIIREYMIWLHNEFLTL